MAEEGGGNPERQNMVSVQPSALSTRLLHADLLMGSGGPDFREIVDQRKLAEPCIQHLITE
jgi:hypothetical protein